MPILNFILCFLFQYNVAQASSSSLNYRGYSARALGMGNAFSAVVNDSNALYYNPAALSQIKGVRLTIMDPYVGVNDLSELSDTLSDASDADDADQFVTLIRDLYGENLWLAAGAKVGLSMKNFAFTYYDQAELVGYLTNPTYPTVDFTYKNDVGFHIGLAFELSKNLHAGIGLRTINRTGGQIPISVETLESLDADTLESTLLREGKGTGADLGLLYKMEGALSPAFSFAWLNAGDISFTKTDTDLAPTSEKSYMSLGMALTFDLPLLTVVGAVDYNFIDRSEIPIGKKIDLGLEIDLPILTVRGGFHHGYYTAGASIDLFILRLDAATFAEELGAYPGQEEDRRYIIQLTMELGVDADFNFYKLDASSRRKLKQRR